MDFAVIFKLLSDNYLFDTYNRNVIQIKKRPSCLRQSFWF
ncbi:hypothetical protein FSS13T_14640 [Flavobacterium saliperosum S13]|uniref:Uncharacterized protein n=1 Tax=Flavobacterium saliperosum S13 TaxID=1341155 RepID=A0ABP2ZWG4_9FLAO|nr:hypothetical protein FSS13T_14640 [Flavobacterium saliperosum S13]